MLTDRRSFLEQLIMVIFFVLTGLGVEDMLMRRNQPGADYDLQQLETR